MEGRGNNNQQSVKQYMDPVQAQKVPGKLGVFHANQISMCLDPHLN